MIKLKEVTVSYGGAKVLENINLDIKKGEVLLLTGLSGSGKSTLLKLVNGLIPHYDQARVEGKIEIAGKNPLDMELYEISKLVSSVFQNPKTHFFNTETTLELVFYLENIGLDRKEMGKRLDEAVDLFGIGHLLDRSIFELSGGEKQILSIAQAYMSGNEIIVLDEPTANLDYLFTEKVGQALKILKENGKTILISEHRFPFLQDLVDKVCLLEQKQIKREFTGEEFFSLEDEDLHKLGLRGLKTEGLEVAGPLGGRDYGIKKYEKEFKDHRIEIQDRAFSQGEIVGIVGRNGLGKSTLVKSLMGQVPAQDQVYYLEKKQGRRTRMRTSYLLMQDVGAQLFTESVLAEVRLGQAQDRIDEVLQALNLEAYKNRHPMSLSGGQKQRLALATAILSDRPLLFLDEPTSGMDYLHMRRIAQLLASIKQDRIIFLISHDQEFLGLLCQQVLNLEEYVRS